MILYKNGMRAIDSYLAYSVFEDPKDLGGGGADR